MAVAIRPGSESQEQLNFGSVTASLHCVLFPRNHHMIVTVIAITRTIDRQTTSWDKNDDEGFAEL